MPGLKFEPTHTLIRNCDAPLPPDLAEVKPAAPCSGAFRWRGLFLLALLVSFAGSAAESSTNKPASWVPLSGCRFMSEENSDGDSFHVEYGQREFIFRLYFVDAPETDRQLKDHIREQCEYFRVAPEEILKAGDAAKKFTAQWLRQRFTVTTRWQNAMGRSRLPRYYALLEANGQDLAELLVSRGLARARGTIAILPDGTRAKDHMEKLRKVEAEAKARQLGIWVHSKSTGK